MAIAPITDLVANVDAQPPVYIAADVANKWLNDGRTSIRIRNASGAGRTLTMAILNPFNAHEKASEIYTCPDTEDFEIPVGKTDPARFNDASGYTNFILDSAGSVTITAVRRI